VTAEDIGFPFAAQVARLTRQHAGRANETVGLITDGSPAELSAPAWLAANRQSWGIENGNRLRLDVSLQDDRCRGRIPKSLWILGRLRRRVVSLFLHWRERQPLPQYRTPTDFHSAMGEENLPQSLALVTHPNPKL
jgi:hypothetical protein